jgi:hypothetical protein
MVVLVYMQGTDHQWSVPLDSNNTDQNSVNHNGGASIIWLQKSCFQLQNYLSPLKFSQTLTIKLHKSRGWNSVNLMSSRQIAMRQVVGMEQWHRRNGPPSSVWCEGTSAVRWHDRAWSLWECGHVCDIMSRRSLPSRYSHRQIWIWSVDMVHGPATVLRVYECTHDVCFGSSNPCAVYELGEECHYDPSCICDQSWPLTSVVASNFATHWAFHICELTMFSSNCLFSREANCIYSFSKKISK